MPEPLILAIGLAGQGAFFLRFFLQWLASERAGAVVVPRAFWILSLVGSVFALAYALLRQDLVFAAGTATNFIAYGRNLLLARGFARLGDRELGLLATVVALGALTLLAIEVPRDPSWFWFAIGGLGQLLWMTRFPLQWIQSERRGAPVMSPQFFGVTLAGSLFLLGYALHTGDVVFILGMLLVPVLAVRNLVLGRREAATAPLSLAETAE